MYSYCTCRSVVCIATRDDVLDNFAKPNNNNNNNSQPKFNSHLHDNVNDVDGVVAPDSDCDPAKRPPTSRPCLRVCDYHRRAYTWVVGPWTTCSRSPGKEDIMTASCSSSTGGAVYGEQRRDVTCAEACVTSRGEHNNVTSSVIQ